MAPWTRPGGGGLVHRSTVDQRVARPRGSPESMILIARDSQRGRGRHVGDPQAMAELREGSTVSGGTRQGRVVLSEVSVVVALGKGGACALDLRGEGLGELRARAASSGGDPTTRGRRRADAV